MNAKRIVSAAMGLFVLGALGTGVLGGQEARAAEGPTVVIKTNLGTIEAVLFKDKAPISVKNFLKYVSDKAYDGTIFHRVIPNFMIQGGGFDKQFSKKETRAPIKNEADNGMKNEKGTLAMARTSDVNSATNQFFINLKHNQFLDNGARDFGYAVFGKVSKGMDIVNAIAKVKTGSKGPFGRDCPLTDVIIESIRMK
jgi:peptidyl-prolyl cis-trans isomerase A (cyclophilin A)